MLLSMQSLHPHIIPTCFRFVGMQTLHRQKHVGNMWGTPKMNRETGGDTWGSLQPVLPLTAKVTSNFGGLYTLQNQANWVKDSTISNRFSTWAYFLARVTNVFQLSSNWGSTFWQSDEAMSEGQDLIESEIQRKWRKFPKNVWFFSVPHFSRKRWGSCGEYVGISDSPKVAQLEKISNWERKSQPCSRLTRQFNEWKSSF